MASMTLADRVGWLRRLAPALAGRGSDSGSEQSATSVFANAPALRTPASARPTRGISLPRFNATASDQLDRRAADQLSVARLKLRNAYTPAQPITDPWRFAGRTELLTKLIRAIEDQRLHAIIYGVRGIGKTSLLHVLAGMAQEARYQVSYVTCGASATFTEMFRSVAAGIPLLYHSAYGPTSVEGEQGATLIKLVPPGEISPRLASELCAKITGTRLLIVLDEFDRPSAPLFNREVAEFIKNLSDRAVRVQLVVAGVAEDLEDLMRSNGVVQRNVVAIQVPRMSADEVSQLIRSGEEASGLSFDEDAIEALCFSSAGMPYLASLLSQHAALSALNQGRMTVETADVSAAVSEVLSEIRGRLTKRVRTFLEGRVRNGAVALGAIASFAYLSGTGLSPDHVRSMFPDKISGERAKSELASLLAEGVLVPSTADGLEDEVRFKDENELLYLWLLTVKEQLAST